MSSKFSHALQAKQASLAIDEEIEQTEEDAAPIIQVVAPEAKKPNPQITFAPAAVESSALAKGMVGKRSNADYMQVNVYLKKETTNKAKIALLQAKDERDFSELMEDLLSTWVSQARS